MSYVDMDLLPYVESRAIREHLAAIGHRFTPLEAAVLIRNNENLSFEERLRAYRELLERSEDVPLPANEWFPKPMRLHEWLREDVALSELARAEFEREKAGAVWLADGNRQYSSFTACAADLNAGGGYAQKVWRDDGGIARTVKAMLLPGGGYAFIDADGSGLPKPSSVMGLLSFWIDVPTPFHKGELLQGRDGELYILTDDERWHMTPEERRDRETNGCFLDMYVCVRLLENRAEAGKEPAFAEYPYLALDYPDNVKEAAHSGK